VAKRARGPEHPETAIALITLGFIFQEMGEYAKAEPLHQEALRIRQKVLGSEHSDTATSLNNVLVAENLDRISRQGPKIARKLIEQIVDNGVDIHIVTGNLKLTPGWENDTPRSVVVDVLLKQAWDYSQNLSRREKAAWGNKKEKGTNGKAITSLVPNWLRATKGEPVTVIPERAATVKRIFELAGLGLGRKRIIRNLIAEKRDAFGGAGWVESYVGKILNNRAVLGEYQPCRNTEDGGREIDGEPIPGFFPQIVSQTEWDTARAAVDSKNRNHKGAGRKTAAVDNLFSPLVRDASNRGRIMSFHRNEANSTFLITVWNAEAKSNRISYPAFEKSFLGFLEDLDWKSVAGQSELPEVKINQAKLDTVKAELYKMERVAAKFDALSNDPDLDTKFVLGKLQEANQKIARMSLEREALDSDIKSAKAAAEALYRPEELLKAILGGDPSLRLRLKSEIAKRVSRIDLTFNATVLTSGEVNVTPGIGKTVARISFINGAFRWIFFQGV
jgi:hypothetical protein